MNGKNLEADGRGIAWRGRELTKSLSQNSHSSTEIRTLYLWNTIQIGQSHYHSVMIIIFFLDGSTV